MNMSKADSLRDANIDWNFRFDRQELVKWEYGAPEEEWPYWTVKKRLFDPDNYERVYHLRWMHPDTWEMESATIREQDCFAQVEHADEGEAERLAEELVNGDRDLSSSGGGGGE